MTSAVNPPSVPVPSRAAADRARQLLERALGPSKVLTEPEACERFAADESEAEGRVPDAVVLAESPEDVLAALAVARDANVPITPRAAGTGRTGGATPVVGGIVLSVMGMNRIVEIDRRERVAVVEPGVVLADLTARSRPKGSSIRRTRTRSRRALSGATSPRTPEGRAPSSTASPPTTCSAWRRS